MITPEMITIDGSVGEGGGQVLRTSLTLSLVTGEPFTIEGIRAGRRKPGLLRQHLTAVQAAAAVGRAETEGAHMRSTRLVFRPRGLSGGTHRFAVGTAGSAMLVLQTVLPALLKAEGPSEITVEGGTHNPFAPPFDFLDRTWRPLMARMGAEIELELGRHGFYPAGGGEAKARVEPSALGALDLVDPIGEVSYRPRAIVSALPTSIGQRQLKTVRRLLELDREAGEVEDVREPRGPGNAILIEADAGALTEVFTAFGDKGVKAEHVAKKAAKEAQAWRKVGAPVGEHLADQLLVPLALGAGGRFLTGPLSRHTTTNIAVIKRFVDVSIETREAGEGRVEVVVD